MERDVDWAVDRRLRLEDASPGTLLVLKNWALPLTIDGVVLPILVALSVDLADFFEVFEVMDGGPHPLPLLLQRVCALLDILIRLVRRSKRLLTPFLNRVRKGDLPVWLKEPVCTALVALPILEIELALEGAKEVLNLSLKALARNPAKAPRLFII